MRIWKEGNFGGRIRPLPRRARTVELVVPHDLGEETTAVSDADHQTSSVGAEPDPGGAKAAHQPGFAVSGAAMPDSLPHPGTHFNLPNARVGVHYQTRIEGRDERGAPCRLLAVEIPPGLGLSFAAETGELRGTPLLDGDHRLAVHWTRDGSRSFVSDVLLIVNPDPRTLWKVVEPPADAPYPKPHTDACLLECDGFRLAAASRRGRSHEHAGSFRDDDFWLARLAETGWNLLLVADGAGSARFSRQGARLAVTAAGNHLAERLAGDLGVEMNAALAGWGADPQETARRMGGEFHYLFHEAGQRALHAIEQEAQARGAAPRDYATTLLAAAVRRQAGETFLASFWVGDGAIAAYGPRGKVRLMGVPDSGDYAGQTRFLDRAALGDQGFAKRIGVGCYPDLSAVLLMTDGVSDPRFETDHALADAANWDALWDELAPCLGASRPEQELVDWLGFFSQGHHDDRTLALLW